MYTVGLDADNLVSKLKLFLIYSIKCLANNNVLNLSPLFPRNLFFVYVYVNGKKIKKLFLFYIITVLEKIIFLFLRYFYFIVIEIGKILNLFIRIK
jgi:hypothetical protein